MSGLQLRVRTILWTSLGLTWSCGAQDWGDPRVMRELAAISVADVRIATVDLDRCPRYPKPVLHEHVADLIARLKELKSAQTVGRRESWQTYRIVMLDCGPKGAFRISIGTRPSLRGRVVVILEREQGKEIRLGFYEGREFWDWFKLLPEVAALEGAQPNSVPCAAAFYDASAVKPSDRS